MYKVEGIKSGGFQISMEDMKIRGAGEILGDRQHGTIETFGYDLYIKMLNEEIRKQKGEYREKLENVEIILDEKGYIPESYIQREERLNIYKRFAITETYSELSELVTEMRDRFGKIPEETINFILSVKFKIFAELNHIHKIEEKSETFELYFEKEGTEDRISEMSKKFLWKDISEKYDSLLIKEKGKISEQFVIKEVSKEKLKKYIRNIEE